jgi:tetratricopeptide (TPR) repeat protein
MLPSVVAPSSGSGRRLLVLVVLASSWIALVLLVGGGASGAADPAPPNASAALPPSVSALLAASPVGGGSWAGAKPLDPPLLEAVLADGPEAVAQLAALIGTPEQQRDVRAKFALTALTAYVSRQGAEIQRQVFARGLAGHLRGPMPPEHKAFLIERLWEARASEATAAIAELLDHAELCSTAARALQSFNTPAAQEAVRQALPKASGSCRVALLLAAGHMRDLAAAAEIHRAVADQDRDTRLVALWALANMGDVAAQSALDKVIEASSAYEASKAVDAYLLLASRLLEKGKKAEATAIYKKLMDAKYPGHVRQAAGRGLLAITGEKPAAAP